MPEQLTKHPELTLRVLRSAGAHCGEGGTQAILTACPAERFCKLPGGEVCVYGLDHAMQMTQITPADWTALLSSRPSAPAPRVFTREGMWLGGTGLLLGLVLGLLLSRWWRHRPAS